MAREIVEVQVVSSEYSQASDLYVAQRDVQAGPFLLQLRTIAVHVSPHLLPGA